MEAVASLKNCPMSVRKMRLVVDNIRGKKVSDALGILKYTNKEAALWLEKTLLSAVANWEYKTENSSDNFDLYVKKAFADQGTQLKRFRPAPQGRAHRIRKRTNHITLVVENKKPLADETTTA
ncbi:MAG: 50S ribosomal protein L22 [Saprospiraceae bacterium]|nr:50S ribosomal protein L22 [Saprospiraceae bacterium]MBP7699709.1 50S ribosomal protein L22 [Saprospiraceae bacterium]